jgi:hypothetical protein
MALILIMDVLPGKDHTSRGETFLSITTGESKKIGSLRSGYSEPNSRIPPLEESRLRVRVWEKNISGKKKFLGSHLAVDDSDRCRDPVPGRRRAHKDVNTARG